MQKRIQSRQDCTSPSTVVRAVVRAVDSKTPSESGSTNFENGRHEFELEMPPAIQRPTGRMTQSQQPRFTKITARRADIIKGCGQLVDIAQLSLKWGFERLRRTSIINGQQSITSLAHTVQSKHLASQSNWHMPAKDLIHRNSKAEQLLESLPMKYKKKMRVMIEDYEQERINLMKSVMQLSRTGTSDISSERDRLSERLDGIGKELVYWRSRCQKLQANIKLLASGQSLNSEGNLAHEEVIRLETKMNEMQSQLINSQLEVQILNQLIHSQQMTQKKSLPKVTKQQTKTQPAAEVQKPDSEFNVSIGSQFERTMNKASSSSKYLMPPIERLPRTVTDPNADYIRAFHQTPPSALRPPKRSPVPLLRRALSKGSNQCISSVASSQPESEQDFGKQKVMERRRVRQLLRKFLTASKESKKAAFVKLANEIGMRSEESDSYSNLF